MTMHVFGNSPPPSVATYGLKKAAELGETEYGTGTKVHPKEFLHGWWICLSVY